MSGEGTYAPKSPDLSSFFSAPAPVQQQQPQQIPGYQQYSPTPPHVSYQPQPQQHLQPPPQQGYYQPPPQHYSTAQQQPHSSVGQPYLQSPPQQQQLQTPQSAQQPFYAPPGSAGGQVFGQQSPQSPRAYEAQGPPQQQQQQYFQGYAVPQYQQPQPQPQQYGLPQGYQQQPGGLYPSDSYQALQQGQPPYQPAPPQQQLQQQQQQQQPPPYPQPTSPIPKTEPSATAMPPRKAAAAAAAGGGSSAGSSSAPKVAPSPVKTKFPTARIKRIMQADEEVGKVSQQTPIAVGKALELFMVELVSKSADVARTKNSKRVTAQMLKQVVESDDQWDFLRDIVKKIDPEEKHGRGPRSSSGAAGAADSNSGPSSGTKMKFESDSGDEQPKKRGRPGRKKKA